MTSKSDIAISVQGLSKSYNITHNTVKHTTAAEALVHWVKNPFRRTEQETFWALKDVSFDVEKGDVVGIIGRNGAGKSTLLKVLSRITEPTGGKAILNGRVGSLLEVGTGFHPELTGRENIYMNGAILGMTKREIAKHFDAIVDFAGVAQFLDTPVKRYSSGMYVRLAFAVAAHLNPEILIVDEVLAVGDAEFQKKCLGKMKDVSRQEGRTVVFVSHNMAAIRSLCTSALLLSNGSLAFSGSAEAAVTRYLAVARDIQINALEHNGVRVTKFALSDAETGEETTLPIAYRNYELNLTLCFARPTARVGVAVQIKDDDDNAISSICTPEEGIGWKAVQQELSLNFSLPNLPLYPGRYSLTLDVYTGDMPPAIFTQLYSLTVQPSVLPNGEGAYRKSQGVFRIATGGTAWVDERPTFNDINVSSSHFMLSNSK